jgi:hypothetical protein
MAVKARVLRDRMYLAKGWERDEPPPDWVDGHELLALSLIEDLSTAT